MNQGQGNSTPRKEAGFAMIFRQCLLMTKRLPYPYWHIDLNAGSGHNEKADCPGSPVVFLDEAEEVGRPINAMFCDNDPEAAERLHAATSFRAERFDSSTVAVRCKDNAEALKEFAEWIRSEEARPEYAIGTCVCDPNGYPYGFPRDAILEFATRFPRIDLLLNVNVTLFVMAMKYRENCKQNGRRSGMEDWPDVNSILGLRPCKSHWLVRNPPFIPGGRGHRFVMFLGRNTGKGMTGFERQEFYPIDSDRGHAIVNHLKRVTPEQGRLWEG